MEETIETLEELNEISRLLKLRYVTALRQKRLDMISKKEWFEIRDLLVDKYNENREKIKKISQ